LGSEDDLNDKSKVPPDDGGLVGLSFDHPIPKRVREYGKALDPTILKAGDLILVSSIKPDYTAREIRRYQEKLFVDEHSRWQHAAISGGRFEICEATIKGVLASEYWKYMTGDYNLKIRRLRGADEATRSRIAYYAASSVRRSYGFFTAWNMKNVLSGGNFWHRPIMHSSGVICSQLYFEACMREGYLLANIPPETVCPAHLSMSPLLEDIEPRWVVV
jgi:hypothetical protein